MMQVFDPNQMPLGLFQNYNELFKYIQNMENLKLLEGHICFQDEPWSFTLYTHKRLSYIYPKFLEKYFSKSGKQAYEQELDLLEIYKGDYHNPIQIPVTQDVDIQDLQKNWCQDYCNAHNYVLVEYNEDFENSSTVDTIQAAHSIHHPSEFDQRKDTLTQASFG